MTEPKKKPVKRKRRPVVEDGKITWERPSGMTITTNDDAAVIEHAESQGWKRV